jgi:serine phosphatase RsbU (regulator of sigma subunit)
MNRISGILIFLLAFTAGLHAQIFQTDLDRGFKALDKNEYDKAIGYFSKELSDDSANAGANFGMAQVYFSKGYTGFNAETADKYIIEAATDFKSASRKEVSSLSKLNVTQASIDELNERIDDEIFSSAAATFSPPVLQEFIEKFPDNKNVKDARSLIEQLEFMNITSGNSEEALNTYIRNNPNAPGMDKAIKVRNKLAFEKAKSANTIEALQEFIATHPDADEIEEANLALASLEFVKAKQLNTIAAFDSFMVHYPEALEFREAMNQRNQLAYILVLEEQATMKAAQLAAADKRIQTTGNWLNFMIAGLVVVIIFAFILYRGYNQKKKSNEAITLQKEIIEQKNNEIVDSINYAKRIQSAMLPSLEEIRKHLPETFVYFRPRNIVSGDFYWFAEHGDKIFLAAADCTGHGVPGSLVSMIGFNTLNQIVNEKGIANPGEILDELHERVSLTLNKDLGMDINSLRDGMDIALLSINRATREITFSGAVRPLVFVDEDGIKSIRSGIYSIGGIKQFNADPFPTHRIQPKGKATFYLFSDGYADQFGGPQGKKFKMKKLQELLSTVSKHPLPKQAEIVAKEFEQWIGNHEQVDDVCVIGFRY